MHWTYEQYLDQPSWLVQAILAKSDGESEYMKTQEKLAEQKRGS